MDALARIFFMIGLAFVAFATGVEFERATRPHPEAVVCHPSGKLAYWGECE